MTASFLVVVIVLVSLAWATYTFVLYPLGVRLLAKFHPSRLPPAGGSDYCPRVALVISAYNEQAVILSKLENSLSIDYPPDRLEIWVSSDGSTDRTCTIVRELAQANPRIRLMAHPVNRGKTAALLDTVRALSEPVDVVVFSDANSMYRKDAIRRLVSHFVHPDVGCVAGELVYRTHSGEGVYRAYENGIKRAQSQLGVPVAAEGSIFAIRRALMPDLRTDSLEDMVIPLRIACAGYRVVYEPGAVSEEVFALSLRAQWKRRRRIINRAFRALASVPEVRNPFRGWTAFHFVSHRLMRWLAPFFILAGWVGLFTMGFTDVAAGRPALLVAGGAAAAALLGVLLEWRGWGPRLVRLVGTFVVSNSAVLVGALSALFRVKMVRWSPER